MNQSWGNRFQVRKGLTFTLAIAALSGCTQSYDLAKTDAVVRAPAATPSAPVPSPSPPSVQQVFRTIKPAIASRAAACLFCHNGGATNEYTLNSNFITDFGFGDQAFSEINSDAGNSIYFNYVLNTWQGSKVKGSAIVPKVELDHSYRVLRTIDPMKTKTKSSFAELLTKPIISDLDGNARDYPAMTVGFEPAAGQPKVIEKNKIYIGAPTQAEILALAPELNSKTVGFASVKVDGMTYDPTLPLSGLEVADGGYVTNKATGAFTCAGDVVIKGPLLLKNVSLATDNRGCRLYVSGSVYIQGAINIIGKENTNTKNLQITSSRAVMMGFSADSASERLCVTGSRTWLLSWWYTRGAGTNLEKNQAIVDDGRKMNGIVDADVSGNLQPYSRLFLNAPQVHSRYIGEFKGALVGEIVLFRLGDFAFSFDSALSNVPVLPAIKSDILRAED